MTKCRKAGLTLALACLVAGCYHATVDTGLSPSGQSITNEWAHSFLYGLVPPSTVETAQRCPNGVARVETQLSFLNMVANGITFGLYSPMSIHVACASARAETSDEREAAFIVEEGASFAEAHEAFERAIAYAVQRRAAAYVVVD